MYILQNFAIQIDVLRVNSGMTIVDLCYNICDESSYRRYKAGKRQIPITRLKLFCDRLGVGLDEFLYNSLLRDEYEYKKINELFYALQIKDFDQVNKILKNVHIDEISLKKNKELLEFIVCTNSFELRKITKYEYLKKLRGIREVKDGFYTFNDVLILDKISWIEVENNNRDTLDILYSILTDTSKLYNIYNSHAVIASIFANVANMYTKLKCFEFALEIVKEGIVYCKKHGTLKKIHYLYYLKAYTLYNLNKKEEAMENIARVITIAFSMNNKKEIKYFIDLINKEFGLSIDIIQAIVNTEIMKSLE